MIAARVIPMRVLVFSLLLGACAPVVGAAKPLTFAFKLAPEGRDPFAREVWAEVVLPGGEGRSLRLPAYYAGEGMFAVRARPDTVGEYRLGAITETTSGTGLRALAAEEIVARSHRVTAAETLPAVGLDPRDRRRFALAAGAPFIPLGANLAWPPGGRFEFFREALPAFRRAGLNWIRVWMVHWGGLNLDWLPPALGGSPPAGTLDQRVAARWDELLELAEDNGIYVQLVLQHHGQFSTTVNPAWAQNPWNAAQPGGFLARPAEFFTSPQARAMTRSKVRTIVARWGWSPAVMAWELFNEVHWVDALKLDGDVAAVSRWHDEMADFIRSVDVYGHLITTSTEDLRSPIYAKMDFYQPHLYPDHLLAAVRSFERGPATLDRPVFYGEFGDDHQPLSEAEKKSGVAIVPPVWASLMGEGSLPAQPWLGAELFAAGRLSELGAVAKFLAGSGIADRGALAPFSAVVECERRVPLRVRPGQVWQRRGAAEVVLPLDGREPLALADVPRAYVGSAGSLAEGFPGRATFRVATVRPAAVRVRFSDGGAGGARARVVLDGAVAGEHVWPRLDARGGAVKTARPAELAFRITAGAHTLVLENVGGPDWFALDAIDFGVDVPALAAIGRRDDRFIAAWLWHREGVFALRSPEAVAGTLVLDAVPAGEWTVTWWDTLAGVAAPPSIVSHSGGSLRLPTPPIARHAAVTLTR